MAVDTKLHIVSAVDASIIEGPRDIVEQVGSSVQVKCKSDLGSCKDMTWSRIEQSESPTGPTLLYASNKVWMSYDERYAFNVSRHGACTLSISQLQHSDAGTFTCQEAADWKTAVVTVVGALLYENFILQCFSYFCNW